MIAELPKSRGRRKHPTSNIQHPISNGSRPDVCGDYALLFAVVTRTSGRVELRHFASPQDAEGRTMRLSARERELLCHALATPGFHAIARDEDPELQLELFSRSSECEPHGHPGHVRAKGGEANQ